MKLQRFFTLLFAFTVLSCSNKKSERKELEASNEAAKANLINGYNAVDDWYKHTQFTYQLQEHLATKGQPIAFTGEVKDIVSYKNRFVLIIEGVDARYSESINAHIFLDSNQLSKLKPELSDYYNIGTFIFKVHSIGPQMNVVKGEPSVIGNEENGYVDYSTTQSRLTIIVGELLGSTIEKNSK